MKFIIFFLICNWANLVRCDLASPNIMYGEEMAEQQLLQSSPIGYSVEMYGVKSGETLKFVKESFEKGKLLFTKLKENKFAESVSKTAKWGIPLLKSVGFFAQFVKGFFPTESKEMAFLKEQFSLINNKMDSLELEFGEMKHLVDWGVVKVNIGLYERSIRVLIGKFNEVINAPDGPVKEFMISEFKLFYERSYREAGSKLYEATMNNNLIFSDNLILAIRKYTKEYRKKIQKFLTGLLTLIMKGAQIEIAHLTFAHMEEGIDHWSNIWESRIKNLENKFLATDEQVESLWYEQAEKDIEEFNAKHHGTSNENYNIQLYNFLNDKFPNRQWFTLVYNPVSGGDKHFVFTCGGFIRFRSRGKNIVIGSARRDYTQFRGNEATNLLNSIPTVYKGMLSRAERLLNKEIRPRTGNNCTKYAMSAVVGWGENVWYAGPSSRRAYRHFEGYQWAGAGRTYYRRLMNFNMLVFG